MPEHLQRIWEQSMAAVDPQQIEADFEKSQAAAAEDSFSGFVRRCVRRQSKPWSLIARTAGLDAQRLARFMHGEGSLDTQEVDRLLVVLGVELIGATGRG